MQLKSLVERAHQSRGKEVVEAVQRQPWGPGEQHHEDHQIGRDPLAMQQGISTCDSIGRDLLDAPGRYMPPRAWLQKQRQNTWILGKLASCPYYVQLLICCGASWTFGEKILTVTESNLSRLQVNFTQEIQCHGGEFFQWGALGSYLGKFIMNPQPDFFGHFRGDSRILFTIILRWPRRFGPYKLPRSCKVNPNL